MILKRYIDNYLNYKDKIIYEVYKATQKESTSNWHPKRNAFFN